MLTIGTLLLNERIKRKLTVQQIEKEIRIRSKFIEAIETNDWSLFASKIYIIGIIKSYAKYLGIEEEKALAFFRRDYEHQEETSTFQKRIQPHTLNSTSKRIVVSSVVGIFVIFFCYFGYQLFVYFSPPFVDIISPKVSIIKNADRVKIIGKTEKDASVTILGEKVYKDTEGTFTYEFPIIKGTNTLYIEVIGANGRRTIVQKKYILE
ncbi:MAG: helix-turn-helix domain-containing protein [Candidatus Roizmanbacteria bacterium]